MGHMGLEYESFKQTRLVFQVRTFSFSFFFMSFAGQVLNNSSDEVRHAIESTVQARLKKTYRRCGALRP